MNETAASTVVKAAQITAAAARPFNVIVRPKTQFREAKGFAQKVLTGSEPERRRLRLAAAQCGKAPPFRKRSLSPFPEAEPQEKSVGRT
jgi:hypothetical protein